MSAMTIKASYNGVFDFFQLYLGLSYLGAAKEPAFQVDTKHQTITITSPSDAEDNLVFDTHGLKADKKGEITGGTIISAHVNISDQEAVTITGTALSAETVQQLFEGNHKTRFASLISLLTGTIRETGDQFDNVFDFGAGGKATVNGGDGDDSLFVWHKKNVVFDGGDGADHITFSLIPGAGNAPKPRDGAVLSLTTGDGVNPYGGTVHVNGVENITGTVMADKLTGSSGADTLSGGNDGDDLLKGLAGDDTINVNAGADGKSRLVADGGAGTDTLIYDISTVTGTHTLDISGAGKSTGIFANDKLSGIESFSFVDLKLLDAKHAAIHFIGSNGDDTFTGSFGNDIIDGGRGNDTLTGFIGKDTFVFDKNFGHDTLTGIEHGSDKIQFDSSIFSNFDDVKAHATEDQENFTLTIDAGVNGSLLVQNCSLDELTASDFKFA
jgi:Ca2+-binding RTX toxin-like protein